MHFERKKHQIEMSISYEKVHFKMTLICVVLVKKLKYKNSKVFHGSCICNLEIKRARQKVFFNCELSLFFN